MPKLKAGSPADVNEWEPIPEGEVVEVTLSDVEFHEFTWKGDNIEKLRWTFMVTEEGPWKGRSVRGETSTNFVAHPQCRAYQWAWKLTGNSYPEGSELDTDDLVGLPARALIEHKPGKDGRVWERVRDVLPTRKAQAIREQAEDPVENPF